MVVPLLLLALIGGLLLPLSWASLPPWWLPLSILLPAPLGWRFQRLRGLRYLLPFGLGLTWACLSHQQLLDQRLSPELDGQRVLITAQVAGLPQPTETGWRFELEQAQLVESGQSLPPIRAHWFGGEAVNPGSVGALRSACRLAGMSNPGVRLKPGRTQGIGALEACAAPASAMSLRRLPPCAQIRQQLRGYWPSSLGSG